MKLFPFVNLISSVSFMITLDSKGLYMVTKRRAPANELTIISIPISEGAMMKILKYFENAPLVITPIQNKVIPLMKNRISEESRMSWDNVISEPSKCIKTIVTTAKSDMR